MKWGVSNITLTPYPLLPTSFFYASLYLTFHQGQYWDLLGQVLTLSINSGGSVLNGEMMTLTTWK